MTFYSGLAEFSDNVCVHNEQGDTLTYRQIIDACEPLEKIFNKQRSLVLLYASNSAGALITYLAALRSGSVIMLVNAKIPAALTASIIQSYRPNFVCGPSQELLEMDLGGAECLALETYSLVQVSGEAHQLHPDLAVMLSTSGSTGSPKFVRLSYKAIQANAESIASYLQLDGGQRAITTLPMAYSYGLSVINSHMSVGAQLLQTDSSLMTKEFWQLFDAGPATSIAGVPYTYEMLKRLRFFRRDLSHLDYMTQAGGRLSQDLTAEFADAANDRNIRFYTMYGQTEATARIAYVPCDKAKDKAGSIGVAIPGGRLEVVDSDGKPVDVMTDGELVYHGDNVMMGYAESIADLALDDGFSGVLATGDLGHIDSDGYATITGRLKRFIKLFGNRVNLDEIDRYVASLQIEAVSGGEDDLLRIAVIDQTKVAVLKDAIVSTFEFDHRAVEVFAVTEIPRNASGKILYAELFNGNDNA